MVYIASAVRRLVMAVSEIINWILFYNLEKHSQTYIFKVIFGTRSS